MMDWVFLVAVPMLSAFAGGLTVHMFTKSRDALNQRRTLRVEYLIDAYRRLTNVGDRASPTQEQIAGMESAVADILLLGHAREVRMAEDVLQELSANGGGSLQPLVRSLRESLRTELNLPRIEPGFVSFRFTSVNHKASGEEPTQ